MATAMDPVAVMDFCDRGKQRSLAHLEEYEGALKTITPVLEEMGLTVLNDAVAVMKQSFSTFKNVTESLITSCFDTIHEEAELTQQYANRRVGA